MNICFYTTFLPNPQIGGIERVTYNLSCYFKTRGIGVYNITNKGSNVLSVIPENVSINEKVHFINEFIRRNKIDIIIDQYGDNPLIHHPHIPITTKIVYCYHLDPDAKHVIRSLYETFNFEDLKGSILNLLYIVNTPRRRHLFRQRVERMIKYGVDKAVYLSSSYKLSLQKKYGIASSKITVIPNAAEKKLELLPDFTDVKTKVVMWCGRIVHNHKNVLFIPRMWKSLEKKHPDWKLLIVGDGCDRRLLEKKINKLGLKNIEITGFADPYPYYRISPVFISPSFNEGFPMVLIESMAHGCVPVVYDCCPSYNDLIDNGDSGFIVPDMDEPAFIEACDKLMSDENLRHDMSYKAKECIKKISIDKIGKSWMDLFDELIS